MRRLLLFLLLILSLLLVHPASVTASIAPDSLTMDVRVGFDGYCVEGHWLPVEIQVYNSGPDIETTLEVQSDHANAPIYSQNTNFPSGTSKTIRLQIMPEQYIYRVITRLQTANQQLASQTVQVNCLSRQDLLVGILSNRPTAFDFIAALDPPGGRTVVARLALESLPSSPGGLDSLGLLIIAATDTGSISSAQHTVLSSWVASGGTLFVAGGPEWQSTLAGLDNLLPGIPSGARTLQSLSGLFEAGSVSNTNEDLAGPLVVLPLEPIPGTRILIEQTGLPLLLERRYGDGRLVYLAADPTLSPLVGWNGMENIFTNLFSSPRAQPSWGAGIRNGYSAEQALANIPDLVLPPAWVLSCFLGIYILMVGPLNLIVLRRVGRREWAWITIPLISLFFAVISYAMGWRLLGVKPIKSELSVVQVWPGVPTARLDGLVAAFTPQRARYDLRLLGDLSAYAIPNSQPWLNDSPWHIQLGTGIITLPAVQFDNAALKGLAVQGLYTTPGIEHDLRLSWQGSSLQLSGTVNNTSGIYLKDTVLLGPGIQQFLGDLPTGDTRQLQALFQIAPRASPLGLTFTQPGPIYRGAVPSSPIGGWNNTTDPFYIIAGGNNNNNLQSERRSLLLNSFNDYSAPPGLGSNGYIYIAGWSDQPLIPIELLRGQSQPYKNSTSVLYIFALDLPIDSNHVQVILEPGSFLWQGSSANGNLATSPYDMYLDNSEMQLNFIPALPLPPGEVNTLTLHLTSFGAQGQISFRVSLWDFTRSAWDEGPALQPIQSWGSHTIQNPEHYVSPSGEIRLRLDNRSQNQKSVTATSIEAADFSLTIETP